MRLPGNVLEGSDVDCVLYCKSKIFYLFLFPMFTCALYCKSKIKNLQYSTTRYLYFFYSKLNIYTIVNKEGSDCILEAD